MDQIQSVIFKQSNLQIGHRSLEDVVLLQRDVIHVQLRFWVIHLKVNHVLRIVANLWTSNVQEGRQWEWLRFVHVVDVQVDDQVVGHKLGYNQHVLAHTYRLRNHDTLDVVGYLSLAVKRAFDWVQFITSLTFGALATNKLLPVLKLMV
jgi:hypothetical protein